MGTPWFYVPLLQPGRLELPTEEARHARQSRRLRAGDAVAVFDGRGRWAEGVLAEVGREAVCVEVGRVTVADEPRPRLALATALPKGPRQDVLIEKITELGVAELRPLRTRRSVAEMSSHRLDRWQRAAIEAAKQSRQAWLPVFRESCEPADLAQWMKEADAILLALSPADAAAAGARCEPAWSWWPPLRSAHRVAGLIGPEGGWEPAEVEQLIGWGARPISLGPAVLRIETAAVALAALVHSAQAE